MRFKKFQKNFQLAFTNARNYVIQQKWVKYVILHYFNEQSCLNGTDCSKMKCLTTSSGQNSHLHSNFDHFLNTAEF